MYAYRADGIVDVEFQIENFDDDYDPDAEFYRGFDPYEDHSKWEG